MTRPQHPGSAYLRPSEVAQLFGVHMRTVSRWTKALPIPHTRTLGGHARYDLDVIRQLARQHGIRVEQWEEVDA